MYTNEPSEALKERNLTAQGEVRRGGRSPGLRRDLIFDRAVDVNFGGALPRPKHSDETDR